MKIYCMSDIHGCKAPFDEALSLVQRRLEETDTKLIVLGDYVHGGPDGRGVMDRMMELQKKYGTEKVIAILGNHDEAVAMGLADIDDNTGVELKGCGGDDRQYIKWLSQLPRFYTEGKTIFTHAGIDEEAGELWICGTSDHVFTGKYPPGRGRIPDLDMKVVAGHVGTSELAGDPGYHDIYYDGESHYYIDGTVLVSGVIPVLMVDTVSDTYYKIDRKGKHPIRPYRHS